MFSNPYAYMGLLGGQQRPLLGQYQPTQNLMQQYLQQMFMRRYQPPAIQQQPGMVGSQMGQGGMQYMAPKIPAATDPTRPQAQAPAQPGLMPWGMGTNATWNPFDGQYSGGA